MYFVDCEHIFFMTPISCERYYILKKHISIYGRKIKPALKTILSCVFLGFFWSAMPLIGWSYYSLEHNKISCSVEWKEKSLNLTSYKVEIFFSVFIIPFSVTIFTNLKSIFLVSYLTVLLNEFFI